MAGGTVLRSLRFRQNTLAGSSKAIMMRQRKAAETEINRRASEISKMGLTFIRIKLGHIADRKHIGDSHTSKAKQLLTALSNSSSNENVMAASKFLAQMETNGRILV